MERESSLISDALLDQAIARERARAMAVATTERLAAVLAFVALGLASRGQAQEWSIYLPMLTAYATIALAFFLLRHRPISPRLAWLSGLIDVGAVYVMQREVIPFTSLPRVLATFSLAPFTLLV